MPPDRLSPLLHQFVRYLRNHRHGKFQSQFQTHARHISGHRPGCQFQFRGISSTAQTIPEVTTTENISPEKNVGDICPASTTSGNDPSRKATAKKNVAILWDLDNKRPYILPETLANAIRSFGASRGKIVEYSAMANVVAFRGLPLAAIELKKERQAFMQDEAKGLYKPSEPYRCPVCGAKSPTMEKMNKHYDQLHARELKKKWTHIRTTKSSKKRTTLLKEIQKRRTAHMKIKFPENEHKVFQSLERAGVLVRVVKQTPQAADAMLKGRFGTVIRENENVVSIIISDDSDFCDMVKSARRRGVYVIVIGDYPDSRLAQVANEWFSWRTLNMNVDLTGKAEIVSPGRKKKGPTYVVDDDVMEELLAMEPGDGYGETGDDEWLKDF
ncbi:uncharacterized protein GGS25DRAFT_518913 [Hypoxylon fragiforme]|uniref:uncharacterized protein n=1 Tax=Hypoxylon fragiforme TaxID=63214 RepID=UPI0020C62D95|nr:uncharacterized protein GGS25DRAFT_518913 [Hypoxylon fragiforme]KAI2610614.1 hypothetical protein GGS25DRAFT_518913 [Hypoxylon fragiforme]